LRPASTMWNLLLSIMKGTRLISGSAATDNSTSSRMGQDTTESTICQHRQIVVWQQAI
jgi:hypothetical protein